MLFIQLNKIERSTARGYRDNDDEGDVRASSEGARAVYVNAASIRNMQPRRDGAVGSRLTFNDGGGYAVRETCEQIIQLLGNDADLRQPSADILALQAPAASPAAH